jgi:hypothetical protein
MNTIRQPAADNGLDPHGTFADQDAAAAPSDRRGRNFLRVIQKDVYRKDSEPG